MWSIRQGHALDLLQALPDQSVQMVATSPPYWGLRDYGDEGKPWPSVTYAPMPGLTPLTIPASTEPLGLEADPWAYVGHLVAIFREVRRVLRDDGVLFLNLGDSYAAGCMTGRQGANSTTGHNAGQAEGTTLPARKPTAGLKTKDLVGIPWRAAYALQADGWYLRSDCIWAKPNPMPESVRDRPTKAHEYVFLLTKGPRYFWDQEAVRETQDPKTARRYAQGFRDAYSAGFVDAKGHRGPYGGKGGDLFNPNGRNLRTVWTIATAPYPGAHFAVWPSALAERCIKAGSSQHGACSECGAPWVRVVGREKHPTRDMEAQRAHYAARTGRADGAVSGPGGMVDKTWTTGWAPSCTHDADRRPCAVLDPFSGAGTTGLVAARLGRDYIGLEQSAEYAQQSRERIVRELGASREQLEQMGDTAPDCAQMGMF